MREKREKPQKALMLILNRMKDVSSIFHARLSPHGSFPQLKRDAPICLAICGGLFSIGPLLTVILQLHSKQPFYVPSAVERIF